MTKPATEKPPKPDVESDSDSSDDEDYAPDDKDFQSDGEDEGDSSDDENNETHDADEPTTTRSGKRRADTDPSSTSSQKKPKPLEPTPQEQAEALIKKSRLDALWAEMNSPVSIPAASSRKLDLSLVSGSSADKQAGTGSGSSGKMVTITTTYDFAGETVTVTKDVPEDSKEAKEFARKNGKAGDSSSSDLAFSSTSTAPAKDSILSTAQNPDTATTFSTTDSKPNSASTSTSIPGSTLAAGGPKITTRPSILDSLATQTKVKGSVRYIRKKSNLDELAATYGVKKPAKLNTLEKSKLDWNNFVGKEGIEDELKHHNKDGYMEKVAFLQRTDERRDEEYQQLKKKRR
ncbi:swr complex subunit [Mortierella sp. GBA35]|nr:swr complex subunit [Mortierella sp. GBA35]